MIVGVGFLEVEREVVFCVGPGARTPGYEPNGKMMDRRRRQATKEELEQGQKEMKAAEARMKREARERGELPIEDGKVEKGGKGVSKVEDGVSTRSPTTTLQHTTSHSKAAAVTPAIEEAPGSARPNKEDVHSRTPKVFGPKGHEKKEVKGEEVEERKEATGHGMVGLGHHGRTPEPPTAPELPLFTPEQLESLRQVQAQAPWLYARFEMPQTAPPVVAPQRPTLLAHEVKREEMESRSSQELIAYDPSREMYERDELMKHLQQVIFENGLLKEEAKRRIREDSMKPPTGFHETQVHVLLEENHRLQNELRRLNLLNSQAKEDEQVFATPNGSSGHEETGGRGRGKKKTPTEDIARLQPEEKDEREEEEREACEKGGSTGKGRGSKKKEPNPEDDTVHHQTLQVILKLVEGMQKIQDRMSKGSNADHDNDPETVKRNVELPKLQEFSCESAPIDFADWLLVLSPLMADLTPASEEWWNLTLEQARQWYQNHLTKSPLERLTHQIAPSSKTGLRRGQRHCCSLQFRSR